MKPTPPWSLPRLFIRASSIFIERGTGQIRCISPWSLHYSREKRQISWCVLSAIKEAHKGQTRTEGGKGATSDKVDLTLWGGDVLAEIHRWGAICAKSQEKEKSTPRALPWSRIPAYPRNSKDWMASNRWLWTNRRQIKQDLARLKTLCLEKF